MYWLSNSLIHEHYQTMATGGASAHWVNFIAQTYISNGARVLSMGCGEGALERHLTLLRSNLSIQGIDFSSDRIRTAISAASNIDNANIIYDCVDFVKHISSHRDEKYDCVIFNMSLHHSEDPYNLLLAIKSVLKPAGKLILNEYIGPSRLQTNSKVRKLIRHFLDHSIDSADESIRRDYIYPRIIDVQNADPSEAINSSIIDDAARELFKIIYFKSMSSGFLPNLTEFYVSMSSSLVKRACYLDRLYLDFSILEPEYSLYVLEMV